MKIIYAQETISFSDKSPSIFLAGPTPRSYDNVQSWRPEACEYLKEFEGNVIVPEMRNGIDEENFDYKAQIRWEIVELHLADIILFWIPRDFNHLPGFTTNIEWGYYLAQDPSKMVVGFPIEAVKIKYIEYRSHLCNIPIFHTLKETCDHALMKLNKKLQ